MPAWERMEERRSIIRDGCDLTARCSFGDERFGTQFTLLAGLSGPVTNAVPKTETTRKAEGSRQLRLKKLRSMLKYRDPKSPN